MARERRPTNSFPAWFYPPVGEGEIYQSQAEVPEGWSRRKQPVFQPRDPVTYDRDELVAQLQSDDIDIDPRWGVAQMKKVLDDRSTSR